VGLIFSAFQVFLVYVVLWMAEGKEIWISSVGKAIRDEKKHHKSGFYGQSNVKNLCFLLLGGP
jgi:hypothetical protein